MNYQKAREYLKNLQERYDRTDGVTIGDIERIIDVLDTPKCDKPKECEHEVKNTDCICKKCGECLLFPGCRCATKPELAKGYVPEESNEHDSKLEMVIFKEGRCITQHIATLITNAVIKYYSPIIEQTRKDAHDDGFVQGLKEGKRKSIEDMQRAVLFGTEKQ